VTDDVLSRIRLARRVPASFATSVGRRALDEEINIKCYKNNFDAQKKLFLSQS